MGAKGLRLGYAEDARVLHPARRSMRSFVKRRRRIAGGFYQLEPIVARDYADSGFSVPRSFSTSIGRIRRAMGHRLLDSPWRKLQFAFAELLLYAVNTVERWRLALGGRPSRG
jgi:hypothetical protein